MREISEMEKRLVQCDYDMTLTSSWLRLADNRNSRLRKWLQFWDNATVRRESNEGKRININYRLSEVPESLMNVAV